MKYIGYILFLFTCYQASGQSDASWIRTSGRLWGEAYFTQVLKPTYVGELALHSNFSNNSDNTANIVSHFTQYGFRVWLHHFYTPRFKISGAAGLWQSREVEELNQPKTIEYRLSAQGMYIWFRPGMTLYGWVRADGRFLQDSSHSPHHFSPRLLFVPKIILPLNSKIIREHVWYLVIQNEAVINLDQDGFFNQNTAKLAVGYAFTKSILMEMGYNNQLRFSPSTPTYMTNALNVSVTVNNVMDVLGGKK